MRHVLAFLLLAFTFTACTPPPPQLGPEAARDLQKTRIIKALDLFRDFAIDGEAAKPQVVSTDLARKIVTYHQATLKIVDAAGTDWKALVRISLTAFVATLSSAEQSKVAPYVNLVSAILAEV